jgi:hypothetical protein
VRSSLSALRQEAKWNAMRCRVTATKTQCSHAALRPRLAGRRPGKSKLGTTRRLLNFFWRGSRAGKAYCNGDWMTQNPRKPDLTIAGKPFRSAQGPPFQRNGTARFLVAASEVRIGGSLRYSSSCQSRVLGLFSARGIIPGSNPVAPTFFRKKPFGENVEGLSHCGDKSYANET